MSKNGVRFQSVAGLSITTNKRIFKHPEIYDVPELHWKEPEEGEVSSFIVNQPFNVIIIDKESDSVLYNGRVKVPQPVNTE